MFDSFLRQVDAAPALLRDQGIVAAKASNPLGQDQSANAGPQSQRRPTAEKGSAHV